MDGCQGKVSPTDAQRADFKGLQRRCKALEDQDKNLRLLLERVARAFEVQVELGFATLATEIRSALKVQI